eukprot:Pgem_evm1s6135
MFENLNAVTPQKKKLLFILISGNRFKLYDQAATIVKKTSGFVFSPSKANKDSVITTPPHTIFAKRATTNVSVTRLLELASCHCKRVRNTWKVVPHTKGGHFVAVNQHPPHLHDSLSYLDHSLYVFHFRGGDVFIKNPPKVYGQPLCNFYVKVALQFSEKCILIIKEDDKNPCVKIIEKYHPCVVKPKCKSAACAFNILKRAVVFAGSGVSTFATTATSISPHPKTIYRPFCSKSSCQYTKKMKMSKTSFFCSNGTRFKPWKNSRSQIKAILKDSVSIETCGNK